MQAFPWPLNVIFSAQTHLSAPLFQRPYVWNWADNWVPLWETVQDVSIRQLAGQTPRPRFLGAIVLGQMSALGPVPVRDIIDGQQRLTTLQILLCAARDHYRFLCEARGYTPSLLPSFAQMLFNNPPLQRNEDKFKVWPTNVDREGFVHVMTGGSLQGVWERYGIETSWEYKGKTHHLWKSDDADVQAIYDGYWGWTDQEWKEAERALSKDQRAELSQQYKRALKVGHNMANAYSYFWAMSGQWMEAPDEAGVAQRAQALLLGLQNGIVLVVIGLDPGDDAQQIFETMNALGEPLLPTDLVKNFLFREAEQRGEQVEPLYEQFWKQFDQPNSWWREEVRQGRLSRPRLDVFLGHYLALTTRRDVLATDLFSAYRDWARSSANMLTPAEQLKRFHDYAGIFQRFESNTLPPRILTFFERLRSLDVTTVYPLVLELFHHHANKLQTLEEILIDIESFLVRRLVCGLTTKGYNRVFLDLLNQLEAKGDFSPATVRTLLNTSDADSARWPDDREFGREWMTAPLYRKVNQERMRLLLRALDARMQTAKSGSVPLPDPLSIEHLMPRSWTANWPIPSGADAAVVTDRRDALLHTLGNLTLLTSALNASISNGPWRGDTGKRVAIQRHNLLMLNKSLPSVWNEAAIEKRGQDLLQLAITIWPHP